MSFVAILGAGQVGAAIAENLAGRGRVGSIRLIDANALVGAGKALDLLQAGPIRRTDTRVTAAADPLAAVGATVIVIADLVTGAEWTGDSGLALIERLVRAGATAPMVFAGASQTALLEASARELKLPPHRVVGSAASAIVATARSLAGMELGVSTVELTVVGRPPGFVVGWSAASTAGSLLVDRVPAHRLLAISLALGRFWPPGPHAIGAATATIVEALIFGSRRLHPALTVGDHGLGPAGSAVMVPLELGRLRILSHVVPSLSPQERTAVLTQTSS
jgi:malate dehydrogenase